MSDTGNGGQLGASGGTSPSRGAPLIFISHDTRDGQLAEQFSRLLASVSAGVLKSFRSSDKKGTQGIEYGIEWYPKLMEKLDVASDVVCLLTPRSLNRPWILYEAGVAKGKLNTPVHGLALGTPLSSVNVGPFAQFQNVEDSEEAITKLILQLVSRVPGADPDREAVQMQVAEFKKRADAVISKLAKDEGILDTLPKTEEASVAKIFEEIKVMFQDLPGRLEGVVSENSEARGRRRKRRFHPMMLMEVVLESGAYPGDGILLLASMIREDFPWLYEPLMQVYQATQSGTREKLKVAIERLQRLSKMSRHHPVFREMIDREADERLMFELPHIIDRMSHELLKRRRSKTEPETESE